MSCPFPGTESSCWTCAHQMLANEKMSLKAVSQILSLLLIFISSLQFELQKFTAQILNKECALSPVIVWHMLFPPHVLPLAAKIIFQCAKHWTCLHSSGIWLWPNFILLHLLWCKPDLAPNEWSIMHQETEKSFWNRLEAFGEYRRLV